ANAMRSVPGSSTDTDVASRGPGARRARSWARVRASGFGQGCDVGTWGVPAPRSVPIPPPPQPASAATAAAASGGHVRSTVPTTIEAYGRAREQAALPPRPVLG